MAVGQRHQPQGAIRTKPRTRRGFKILAGLEPATYRLASDCSIHVSYRAIMAAGRVYACMKIYASATDPASLDPRRRHRRRCRAPGGGVRHYHPRALDPAKKLG